jgi:hypothetical protein
LHGSENRPQQYSLNLETVTLGLSIIFANSKKKEGQKYTV